MLRTVLRYRENAELSFVEWRLEGKLCEILHVSYGKFGKESVSQSAQYGKALIGYWSVDSNSAWELGRTTAL
jgi:hypothetical protein